MPPTIAETYPSPQPLAEIEKQTALRFAAAFAYAQGTPDILVSRLWCIVLAKISTEKAFRIDQAVPCISGENVGGVKIAVYRQIQIGKRWTQIVADAASIVHDENEGASLWGLVEQLKPTTSWERMAPKTIRPRLEEALMQDKNWIRSARELTMQIQPLIDDFSRKSGVRILSPNAENLLNLLCYLAPTNMSLRLLHFPHKRNLRWTPEGSIGSSILRHDARLTPLLSDAAVLETAVCELERQGAIVCTSAIDATCAVEPSVREAVLRNMPPTDGRIWRREALYIASSTIPLKYIDRPNWNLTVAHEVAITHLRHTTAAVRLAQEYENIEPSVLNDIAQTIFAAARFPGLKWKKGALDEASSIVSTLQSSHLQARLNELKSLVRRLGRGVQICEQIPGDMDQSSCLRANYTIPEDPRTNAALGHLQRQKALDYYQQEHLSAAIRVLDEWQPLDPPSIAELVVQCQLDTLRGKILRYQGKLHESLDCLRGVEQTMEDAGIRAIQQGQQIFWDEDAGELACELGDVMRDLGLYMRAKYELGRKLDSHIHTPNISACIRVTLAECLFADKKYSEADACLETVKAECDETHAKYRRGLHSDASEGIGETDKTLRGVGKGTKLRYYIIKAKLCHSREQWDEAFAHWTTALELVNKFPPTSGHATRTIHLSQYNIIMHQLLDNGLSERTRKNMENVARRCLTEVANLQLASKDSEATHWISGLNEWCSSMETTRVGGITAREAVAKAGMECFGSEISVQDH